MRRFPSFTNSSATAFLLAVVLAPVPAPADAATEPDTTGTAVDASAATESRALPGSANPSAAALMLELRIERAALERRAFELETRERALVEARRELERRIDSFEAMRTELERRLDKVEEAMGDEIALLSKTYAAMPPQKAAALISALDTELASSILRRMRAKQSAAVLSGMKPDRARTLSLRLARPFSREPGEGVGARPRRGGQR